MKTKWPIFGDQIRAAKNNPELIGHSEKKTWPQNFPAPDRRKIFGAKSASIGAHSLRVYQGADRQAMKALGLKTSCASQALLECKVDTLGF